MKTRKWTDPIIDEIRAIRDEMARESGYDLHVLAERLRASESQGGYKLVTKPPKGNGK